MRTIDSSDSPPLFVDQSAFETSTDWAESLEGNSGNDILLGLHGRRDGHLGVGVAQQVEGHALGDRRHEQLQLLHGESHPDAVARPATEREVGILGQLRFELVGPALGPERLRIVVPSLVRVNPELREGELGPAGNPVAPEFDIRLGLPEEDVGWRVEPERLGDDLIGVRERRNVGQSRRVTSEPANRKVMS